MSDTAYLPKKPSDTNDAQWKAITDPSQYLLIIAGPGTGKTHTLAYRIKHFVARLKDKQQILAVTFTNKAAKEMHERIGLWNDPRPGVVFCATFHSFCLKILKEYFPKQLPVDFQVPSVQQIEELSRQIWPSARAKDRRCYLDEISRSKAKNLTLSPMPWAQQYNDALLQKGWLDFDDLLYKTLHFLTAYPLICQEIRSQYPFIFVDEYQDINPIQHQLLKTLVGETGRLSAIGDPHQAIYGFRGSDVKFFLTFADDFKGAKELTLSENYRSAPNLLSASTQLITDKSDFHIPALTAKIYREGRLVIAQTATDKAEAEYVVHQIEKIVGGTSFFSKDSGRVDNRDQKLFSFSDIAIIFRLNSQRALVQQALDRSGIPYQISQDKIYDDPTELLVNAFKHTNSQDHKGDKVSLLTLHASKGLEFDVVFILGCEENLLPLNLFGMTSDAKEERRLFYVGVTRAKQQLFLVRAASRRLYGKTYQPLPSPFLADIKEELKEHEITQTKPAARKKDDQMTLFS